MRISIASDHAGFEQKEELKAFLAENGHEVFDLGPADESRVDYPDFALALAKSVAAGETERGVLICGTGIGMAMAANKVAGIRAANITSPEFAALCREHNDANTICLSGRFVDLSTNKAILGVFLSTAFGEGRHAARVRKIGALEGTEAP
ncbi:MAG: ribose 5-phosphate isomerase B [Eggerthellaceae bacterium]|nr:ribose 5-phosphate isomerase B [Eggerthellaceae bacterium]